MLGDYWTYVVATVRNICRHYWKYVVETVLNCVDDWKYAVDTTGSMLWILFKILRIQLEICSRNCWICVVDTVESMLWTLIYQILFLSLLKAYMKKLASFTIKTINKHDERECWKYFTKVLAWPYWKTSQHSLVDMCRKLLQWRDVITLGKVS
jgi:hypothetical protein